MTNVFEDQETFMYSVDQTTDEYNADQYQMYVGLIDEEVKELHDAIHSNNKVEQLDALVDILVVTIGAMHSMGADAEGAWNEVMYTNFTKIDTETGKVNKREDGKVIKPEGWVAPELAPFLKKY